MEESEETHPVMMEPVTSCWRAVYMQRTRNLGHLRQQATAREGHGRLAGLHPLSSSGAGLADL